MTEEIIPLEHDSPTSDTNPPISQQPTNTVPAESSQTPKSVQWSCSPEAVRPNGSQPGSLSLENDIQETVRDGLLNEEGYEHSHGHSELGNNS